MNTIREKDEPEVRFQAKDLVWIPLVEALRRIATAKGRQSKAKKKEKQIGSSSGGQAWGANQSFQRFHHVDRSVRTPSYGSSPKKDEMVQACHGRLAGRQSLGGTDVVLDMQAKECDPACTIIGQHFATLGKLVAGWPVEHKDHLEAAWATTWETLKQNALGKLRRVR